MLGALIAGLMHLAPESTRATPQDALWWQAPGGVCPSEAQVRSAVLAKSPESALQVRASAQVTPDAELSTYTLVLSITVDGAETTQTFTDASCSTLADAAVLSIAIARDPSSVVEPEAIDWGTEAEPEAEPEPEPSPSLSPSPSSRLSPRLSPRPSPRPSPSPVRWLRG